MAEQNKERLIIVAGPTAAGKSAAAVELALRIGGEIISADSMQVYRGMDIGSAKIRADEMRGVPHYLLDVLEPEEEFNVTVFQELARKAMDQIRSNGHIPIITGGTGFYIRSVPGMSWRRWGMKKAPRIFMKCSGSGIRSRRRRYMKTT